jgi:hypothetical protein
MTEETEVQLEFDRKVKAWRAAQDPVELAAMSVEEAFVRFMTAMMTGTTRH